MNSVEYNKKMNTLVEELLRVIERSGFSASDAEGVPAWLNVAIEENNKNALITSPFRVIPKPEDY